MIKGVKTIDLVTHNDERGFFREILKSSQINKFGQWSMSWMTQGTIKGFHIHLKQTDYWYCVSGIIKAVLIDCKDSWETSNCKIETNTVVPLHIVYANDEEKPQEYILGDNQPPRVLVIPPGVAHGLKVLQGPAVLMYVTSEEYNPKDEGRIPYDSLGYNWNKVDIR